MPLEPIHRIYQIILKEICVLEYAILLPLVFAGFQITVIHIVERCETLKNVSVFFQQIPPEVVPERVPYAQHAGTLARILVFLGRILQPRESTPLSLCAESKPLSLQYLTMRQSGAEAQVRPRVGTQVVVERGETVVGVVPVAAGVEARYGRFPMFFG